MADEPETQRIARLTPRDEVLARITDGRRSGSAAAARGRWRATAACSPRMWLPMACPATAGALRDGFAVDSALVEPMRRRFRPRPARLAAVLIDVGDALPGGA